MRGRALLSAVGGSSLSRLAIALLLLFGGVVWLSYSSPVDIVTRESVVALGSTMPFMVMSMLLSGARLSVLCGPPVGLAEGIAVNSVAQLVALLVPSRVSEAAKPVGLLLQSDFPLSRGFAVLAVERLFDTAVLTVLIAASLMFVSGPFYSRLAWIGVVFAALAVAGAGVIITIVARPALIRSLSERLRSQRLILQLGHLDDQMSHVNNVRRIIVTLSLSALTWLCSYLVLYVFFATALKDVLTWGQVLVIFVASTIGLVVSVAPGGLGTFEAAVALSLIAFGTNPSHAVAAAILLRIALVLPILALAVWQLSVGSLSLNAILVRIRNRNTQ